MFIRDRSKAAFEALMQQLSTLQATVDKLTALLEEKNKIILNQNRARFGQSSEKRTYLLSDGQLSMFEQAGDGITEKAAEDSSVPEKKEVAIAAHTRKPKRSPEELAANLPEEPVILDLPDSEMCIRDRGKEGWAMLDTLLFDLDGTLLPMVQRDFTQAYFAELVRFAQPLGYPPQALIDA